MTEKGGEKNRKGSNENSATGAALNSISQREKSITESGEQSHLHNNFLATAVMNKGGRRSQFSEIPPHTQHSLEKSGEGSSNN